MPPALEAQSPNHWTTTGVPDCLVLIICCCVTNYPHNIAVQNNKYLLFHTVSLGQESQRSWVSWFWFRVAYVVVVKILPSGPVVRHHAFTGKDLVSIPGQGTKTPKAAWYGHKKKNVAWNYSHTKSCLMLETPFPGWLSHMPGKLVLGVNRKSQFLTKRTPPSGCLGVFITWQLTSPRVSNLRGSKMEATIC